MATNRPIYGSDTALILTSWQGLLSGQYASAEGVANHNLTVPFDDVIIGGTFNLSAAATAGDYVDVRASLKWSRMTNALWSGGIGAFYTGQDAVRTPDTNINWDELTRLKRVRLATGQATIHWGGVSLVHKAGQMPLEWAVLINLVTATANLASANCNYYGVNNGDGT